MWHDQTRWNLLRLQVCLTLLVLMRHKIQLSEYVPCNVDDHDYNVQVDKFYQILTLESRTMHE